MADILTALHKVGLKIETTPGTPEADPKILLPVNPPSFTEASDPIIDAALRDSVFKDWGSHPGPWRIEGSLEGNLDVRLFHTLLQAFLGGTVTLTGLGLDEITPFVHQYAMDETALPLTIFIHSDIALDGAIFTRKYAGCRVASLEIRMAAGEGAVTYTASINGQKLVITDAEPTWPADISEKPLLGWGSLVGVGILLAHKVKDIANVVTTPLATSQATYWALLNNIKAKYNLHRVSLTYHLLDTDPNIVDAADATTEGTALTLVNQIKAKYNAHRTQAGVHVNNDTQNIVAGDDATDEPTGYVLANEEEFDYHGHITQEITPIAGTATKQGWITPNPLSKSAIGTAYAKLIEATLTFERETSTIFTAQNQREPYQIVAGPLTITGSVTVQFDSWADMVYYRDKIQQNFFILMSYGMAASGNHPDIAYRALYLRFPKMDFAESPSEIDLGGVSPTLSWNFRALTQQGVDPMEIALVYETPIDVGAAAIDRAATLDDGLTLIALDNPANETGKITTIEIWAASALTGVKVGAFHGSGAKYTSRAGFATVGNVGSGEKKTFANLSIDVVEGDFIGIFAAADTGTIEADTTGFSGVYYLAGDQFDEAEHTYTLHADYGMSLYGTGAG